MQCPKCGLRRDRVVDTRTRAGGTYRRRECRECRFRWTTLEYRVKFSHSQSAPLQVVETK